MSQTESIDTEEFLQLMGEHTSRDTDHAQPDTEPHDTAGAASDSGPSDYTPNFTALQNAAGDPEVWGREFGELIGHTTGKWIDSETLESWLRAFGDQVQKAAFRHAAFEVANTTLPANPRGDAAQLLLQLRGDLTSTLFRGVL